MTGIKKTTIRKIVRKKLNGWLESITDEVVKDAAKRDVILSGGGGR